MRPRLVGEIRAATMRDELTSPELSRDEEKILRIWLLGRFRVSVGLRVIEDVLWRLRKAQHLIKLLALTSGYRLHRDQVIETLWPDVDPRISANNLHQALHFVRHTLLPDLPPRAAPTYLRLQAGVIELGAPELVWTDVHAFGAAAGEARRTQEVDAYLRALAFYDGDLLPNDLYEDWTVNPRMNLRQTYQSLLLELARLCEDRADLPAARGAFERLLASDPTHEDAHAALMRFHALEGHETQAVRQFEQLREILKREVGVEPSRSTQRLYEEIVSSSKMVAPALRLALSREKKPAHNLPAQLTSFIGREKELVDIRGVLQTTRLLTLTGIGGSGKSRLALQAATGLLADFPDGVWLAELAPLADPSLVPQTVASALKVTEQPGRPILATLIDTLQQKQALLIMDNCEHLLAACVALVDPLLHNCAHLRVLATSREGLGVMGEAVFQVPPLALPDVRQLPPLESLTEFEAIRLFVDRATLVQRNFRLTAINAAAVAEICDRLDGIPLAIELAAALVKVLPPEQIATRLDDRFRLLIGGSRTVLPRHQTLQAAMDWSYNLLPEKEQILLRRLAVFAGGFMLDAAEVVCAGDGTETHQVLDLLTHLVEKSLVLVRREDGQFRYYTLETVRQYGQERLQESGETRAMRQRHRDFFLALVERGKSDRAKPGEIGWFERFDRDNDNLRAALDWSLEAGDPEAVLRMGGGLWFYWETRGYWQEGRHWLEAALDLTGQVSTTVRADALHGAGRLAWYHADFARGMIQLEESLDLSRQLEFKPGISRALFTLGLHAGLRGELARASTLLEEAAAVARELGELSLVANRLAFLWPLVYQRGDYARAKALAQECAALARGDDVATSTAAFGRRAEAWLAHREGDYEQATAFSEEALAIYRSEGPAGSRSSGDCWVLSELGALAREQGNYERATAIYEECLATSRALGFREYMAIALDGLGQVARDVGEFGRASVLHEESLAIGREAQFKSLLAFSLHCLGFLARYQGDPIRASALLNESLSLYQDMGHIVGSAGVCHILGIVARDRGDLEQADELLQKSSRLLGSGAAKFTLVRILEGLAATATARKQFEQAARLFGTTAAAREAMGTPLPPSDRADYGGTLAAVRAGLGDATFGLAWAEGRAMTPQEVSDGVPGGKTE